MAKVEKSKRLSAEAPAASSAQGLADRRELAFISMERTRMPMVVTDPRQPDNPITLANQAFLDLTGYSGAEVVGRNCRFLQGPGTDPVELAALRAKIRAEEEATVVLLNYRKDGSTFWNELFLSPIHDDDGALLYFFASQKDVSETRRANDLEAAERRLLREIEHRAKNALAIVQGIVRLSRSDDAREYAASVQARVDALTRAHSMLADRGWTGVPLARLLECEAEPFGLRRVHLDGPAVALGAEQVQPFALVVHEMLTNAAKHGALSAHNGSVSIRWSNEGDAGIVLQWQEQGGPPPATVRRPSFGAMVTQATVEKQLRGSVSFDWKPTGLEGRIELPVHSGSPVKR